MANDDAGADFVVVTRVERDSIGARHGDAVFHIYGLHLSIDYGVTEEILIAGEIDDCRESWCSTERDVDGAGIGRHRAATSDIDILVGNTVDVDGASARNQRAAVSDY